MPLSRNRHLYGSAPDQCPAALLVIDMITSFEFDGADKVFPRALEAAKAIAALKARALEHMANVLKAQTPASAGIDLAALSKSCTAGTSRSSRA